MKKLCSIILIMSFAYSYGQSIELFYSDTVFNPDTILVDVRASGDHHLGLINTSNNSINLMVKREIISPLSDAENYFCFYECLSSATNQLSTAYPFPAGDTFSLKHTGDEYLYFYTHYDPDTTPDHSGERGIYIVKFEFYDNANPVDKSSVVFKFNSNRLGIADNQTEAISLHAYPNPATSKVFIHYNLKNQASKARILVSNLVGTTVKSIPVSSANNKLEMDVSDLASGIYFYSLEVNGKNSLTKKLVVK
jgi:hypothetical protein